MVLMNTTNLKNGIKQFNSNAALVERIIFRALFLLYLVSFFLPALKTGMDGTTKSAPNGLSASIEIWFGLAMSNKFDPLLILGAILCLGNVFMVGVFVCQFNEKIWQRENGKLIYGLIGQSLLLIIFALLNSVSHSYSFELSIGYYCWMWAQILTALLLFITRKQRRGLSPKCRIPGTRTN